MAELEWERDGIVVLRGAIPPDDVATMRVTLWRELEKRWGMVEGDPSTWTTARPHGLKTTKKAPHVDLLLSPAVRAELDGRFGADEWLRPKHAGQVLVTMPERVEWSVPWRLWHSDFQARPETPSVVACKLWVLLAPSSTGGGATPQLAGSHRLFERHVQTSGATDHVEAKNGFLKSRPWLAALSSRREPDRAQFLEETVIDGVPLRVVECTGDAGDVYVTHPWVFHSIAVNGTDAPRMMRSGAIGLRQTV